MTYHWPYSCSYSVLLSNWTVSWPDDVTLVIHIGFCHWLGTRPSRALVTTARASWDGGIKIYGRPGPVHLRRLFQERNFDTAFHWPRGDHFVPYVLALSSTQEKRARRITKGVPLTSYWYQSKVMWQMLINYIRLIQWYMSLTQIRSLRHLAWGK